jgi:type II secretory pathway pseudopilin PulG
MTLLETIVMLAVVGIVLAAVFPAFTVTPFNLGADLQDFAANLQVAREYAISRGEHYRIRVLNSTAPYQYVLEGFAGGTWSTERTITLRQNVQFTSATLGSTAEFDTRGLLVSTAPPATFVLQDAVRGWTKQVTVDAVGMVDHT